MFGDCTNIDYSNIQKKVKTILIPYFVFSILTYFFWFFLGRHFGEDKELAIPLLKPLVGILYSVATGEWLHFNTPLWFLTCLFIVAIIYYFISKVNKNSIRIILVFLIVLIGYLLSLTRLIILPWSLNISLIAIVFLEFGFISKKLIIDFSNQRKLVIFILLILSLLLTCFFSYVNGRIDMSSNQYGNILFFYLGAFFGISGTIFFSILIPKISIIEFIGKNTIIILALHGIIASFIKGIMVYILNIELSILEFRIFPNIIFTLITLLLSLPLIAIINRYFPIIIGRKKMIP